MKKKNYESPEAETFVVRIERKFCESFETNVRGGGFSTPNANVQDLSEADDWGW